MTAIEKIMSIIPLGYEVTIGKSEMPGYFFISVKNTEKQDWEQNESMVALPYSHMRDCDIAKYIYELYINTGR